MNIDMDELPENLARTLPPNCPPLVTADWVEDVYGISETVVAEAIRIGRIRSTEVHGARSEIVVPVIRPQDAARLWGSSVSAPAPKPSVSPIVTQAVSDYVPPVVAPPQPPAPVQETAISPADTRAANRVEALVKIMVNATKSNPKSVYRAAVEAGYVLPSPGENIGDPVHFSGVSEGDIVVASDGRMGVYIGKGSVLMEATHEHSAEVQKLADIVMSSLGGYRSGEVYRLRDN